MAQQQGMQTIKVKLPTFHDDQVRAYLTFARHDRNVLRAGRRWGKTAFAQTIACDAVIRGEPIGWFAPDYKISKPAYAEMAELLKPILKSSNANDGVLHAITGGSAEVWTLENDRAGRSRKYKKIFIDEAAFGKADMLDVWERAIEPTLLDYSGSAFVLSNTNGNNPENFFWKLCNEKEKYGFTEFHAPTWNNPNMPIRRLGESEVSYAVRRAAAFQKLKDDKPPLVHAQEYGAEFVDWSGAAFFEEGKLLIDGRPAPMPVRCDYVFAILDTATKTKKENDGTAVTYWSMDNYAEPKLICLDYEILQIEGAMLASWLPSVFARLEVFAKECGARKGSAGAWIEDKASGMVLLQHAANNGWPARACPSGLTAMGKQERAISVSEYVYRAEVKWGEIAFNKVITYKGITRNHLTSQVYTFRVGDIDQIEDDLLDAFTYGVAIALGNNEGF